MSQSSFSETSVAEPGHELTNQALRLVREMKAADRLSESLGFVDRTLDHDDALSEARSGLLTLSARR